MMTMMVVVVTRYTCHHRHHHHHLHTTPAQDEQISHCQNAKPPKTRSQVLETIPLPQQTWGQHLTHIPTGCAMKKRHPIGGSNRVGTCFHDHGRCPKPHKTQFGQKGSSRSPPRFASGREVLFHGQRAAVLVLVTPKSRRSLCHEVVGCVYDKKTTEDVGITSTRKQQRKGKYSGRLTPLVTCTRQTASEQDDSEKATWHRKWCMEVGG